MAKKQLFFDLDDTLVVTQLFYDKVNDKTSELVKNLLHIPSLTKTDIFNRMNQIDVARSIQFGLDKDRFPKSWMDTFTLYAKEYDVSFTEEDQLKVWNAAHEIYTQKLPTYPGVFDMLSSVKSLGFEMNILTAGTEEIQRKKIKDAGLESYFDHVYVVLKKDPEIMKSIVGEEHLLTSVMIGNSLRSDIYPALANNMFGFHIPCDTWSYDQYDIDKEHPRYYPIDSVEDIVPTLKKLNL